MESFELLKRFQRISLDDLDETDDVLDWVAAFTSDKRFTSHLSEFASAHATDFEDLKEGSTEYSLKHTKLYEEFTELCESKIEGFLEGKGFTLEQFSAACKKELDAADAAQRNTPRSFFVRLLIAASEFEAFAEMMRRSASETKKMREQLTEHAASLHQVLTDPQFMKLLDQADRELATEMCDAVETWMETSLETASIAQIMEQYQIVDLAASHLMARLL